MGQNMRHHLARIGLVLLTTLALTACAARNEGTVTAQGNNDDDSYCRANNTVATCNGSGPKRAPIAASATWESIC
jgi:hypothetical protein